MKIEANPNQDGFAITFDNGNTLSVQWQAMNHSTTGKSVELSAWDKENNNIPLDDDAIEADDNSADVIGWVPIRQIGEYLQKVLDYHA